jgi:hypothetical protein
MKQLLIISEEGEAGNVTYLAIDETQVPVAVTAVV